AGRVLLVGDDPHPVISSNPASSTTTSAVLAETSRSSLMLAVWSPAVAVRPLIAVRFADACPCAAVAMPSTDCTYVVLALSAISAVCRAICDVFGAMTVALVCTSARVELSNDANARSVCVTRSIVTSSISHVPAPVDVDAARYTDTPTAVSGTVYSPPPYVQSKFDPCDTATTNSCWEPEINSPSAS